MHTTYITSPSPCVGRSSSAHNLHHEPLPVLVGPPVHTTYITSPSPCVGRSSSAHNLHHEPLPLCWYVLQCTQLTSRAPPPVLVCPPVHTTYITSPSPCVGMSSSAHNLHHEPLPLCWYVLQCTQLTSRAPPPVLVCPPVHTTYITSPSPCVGMSSSAHNLHHEPLPLCWYVLQCTQLTSRAPPPVLVCPPVHTTYITSPSPCVGMSSSAHNLHHEPLPLCWYVL